MPRFVGPFSVPDPDADAWTEMVRQNQIQQGDFGPQGPQDSPLDPLNDPDISAEDWHELRSSQLAPEESQVASATGSDQLIGGDGNDRVQLQPSNGLSPLAKSQRRYGSAASFDLSGPVPEFDWSKHPGLVESSIPIWGSAREAIADGYDGNYAGAFGNGLLAGADFFLPEEAIARGLSKAGVKAALKTGADMTWKNVRARMGRAGYFAAKEQGHHWAIPNRWTWVPNSIRNHPMNIKALSAEVHKRIHFNDRINGLPKFNFIEGLVAGTPDWAKEMAEWTGFQLANKTALTNGRNAQPD